MHKSAAEQLCNISKAESQGNWEELNYTIQTPGIVRIFIEFLNRTENSFSCSQENIDVLESDLSKYKTYSSWAKNHPQAVAHAMGKAFVYLFTQAKSHETK